MKKLYPVLLLVFLSVVPLHAQRFMISVEPGVDITEQLNAVFSVPGTMLSSHSRFGHQLQPQLSAMAEIETADSKWRAGIGFTYLHMNFVMNIRRTMYYQTMQGGYQYDGIEIYEGNYSVFRVPVRAEFLPVTYRHFRMGITGTFWYSRVARAKITGPYPYDDELKLGYLSATGGCVLLADYEKFTLGLRLMAQRRFMQDEVFLSAWGGMGAFSIAVPLGGRKDAAAPTTD